MCTRFHQWLKLYKRIYLRMYICNLTGSVVKNNVIFVLYRRELFYYPFFIARAQNRYPYEFGYYNICGKVAIRKDTRCYINLKLIVFIISLWKNTMLIHKLCANNDVLNCRIKVILKTGSTTTR